MKLARFQAGGTPRWGVVDVDGRSVQPVKGTILDWGAALITSEDALENDGAALDLDSVKLLAPIEPESKVVGTGTNYMAHLAALGVKEPPPYTSAFYKPRTGIVDPGGTIRYPSVTEKLDYEVELVLVFGSPWIRDGKRGSLDVLGYTVGNDISLRDQRTPRGDMDTFSHKGSDHTAPVGPWITTSDELGGRGTQPEIDIICRVNGEERQHDNTRNMIWNLDQLIEFVIARTSLTTGTIMFTGTTAGVGLEEPDKWLLQPGDVVETEIEGIGVLRNTIGEKEQDAFSWQLPEAQLRREASPISTSAE